MDTLAERLKYAREKAGLSQQQVADMAGMKQPAYYKVEAGKTQRTTYLNEIARALKVNPDWLLTGTSQIATQSQNKQSQQQTLDELRQKIEQIKNPTLDGMTFENAQLVAMEEDYNDDTVPIISWVAAGSWSNVEPVSLDDEILGKLPRPRNLSKNGFALIVKGRSMLPEFKPEDIIFVEPETGFLRLKDGDLVVVSCNDDKEATFKQLVIGETSNDMYLKPLNPEWKEQKMLPVGDCNLVGKVVGKYVIY